MKLNNILSALGIIGMMIWSSIFSEAARFEINPSTGDTKMYCYRDMYVKLLTQWVAANWISYKVQFNTGEVSLTHQASSTNFPASIVTSVIGNIYSYSSNTVGSNTFNGTSNQETRFRIRSTGLTLATQLFFPVPSFGPSTTADGITINDYNNGAQDSLTSVGTGDFTFSTGPCISDITSPIFSGFFPTIGSFMNYLGNTKQYTGNFTTYDWFGNGSDSLGNSTFHYWFTGGDTSILTNYLAVPGNTVDNQAGVNSGTLNVQVIVGWNTKYSGYTMNLNSSQLTITNWTGVVGINPLTWDGKQRGYNVQFVSTTGFGVEQQVSVTTTGLDNLGNPGSTVVVFNNPVAPVFTLLTPSAFVDLSTRKNVTTFQWRGIDTWAGVDTGSIRISIIQTASGSLADGQLTGKIYSGSDLTFTLISGAAGVGNSGGYLIGLTGTRDFPADSTFQVTLTGFDLVGNTGLQSFTFTTRKPCSYYGCADPLDITFVQNPGNNFLGYGFTGILITGSDYPYLSLSGNVLSCGLQSDVFTGTLLTGNIISDIVQPYKVLYTGTELYITGGTVSISGNIIIVIPN